MFKQITSYVLIPLAIILLNACGGEEAPEPEAVDAPVVNETEVQSPGDDNNETPGQYTYESQGSVADLPKIKSVSIAPVSRNIRDGFRALVQTDGSGDTDFVYEWKHNDQRLIGETDSVLKWRDEFKKGDKLSLSVVPVSELGQGLWVAEGAIMIPNSPPQIISQPEGQFETGEFSYTVEAADPDGDSFDYTLRGAPVGMTIEPATGLITWKYGAQDAGDYEVLIIVTDSEGAETTQTLNFTIHGQDAAP